MRGDQSMLPKSLAELLKLSASDRIEIAMALWDSLTETDRDAQLAVTPEQEADLDRRLAEHIANPASAIRWNEVRRNLADGCDAASGLSLGEAELFIGNAQGTG